MSYVVQSEDGIKRDRTAWQTIVDRADLTPGELLHTAETLERIASVDLKDFMCAPAFDRLGNANTKTPEWRQWRSSIAMLQEARRLADKLRSAYYDNRDT